MEEMVSRKDEIPKWESELWDYISSGDGMRCAKYDSCWCRATGEDCTNDNLDLIRRLLDDKKLYTGKYNNLKTSKCCTVIGLVEQLAKEIIQKQEVNCIPVPASVAYTANEQQSIEIRLVPLSVIHGAIWHLNDGWVIQINKNDPPARRRFTLFHEIFHVIAHSRSTPVFSKKGSQAGSFNELLADFFAICLMMPRRQVEAEWAKVKNLHRMSQIFGVEKPLIWLRLRGLGLI